MLEDRHWPRTILRVVLGLAAGWIGGAILLMVVSRLLGFAEISAERSGAYAEILIGLAIAAVVFLRLEKTDWPKNRIW